ncbi:hypothetical protein NEA10_20435 [Phormidium yuhuli AB48]|uniref:Uncharacterized protein n=1 Tax=Phormidium yuhuli AB48 TaxID=2940671 RepID=A0ABY5APM3_9CYAN|nr:hypothetical protein [Phormidium yuhuli]USR91159.1 hypothetical protein NEA10_20435 [Phormidium yuhuli AB48]
MTRTCTATTPQRRRLRQAAASSNRYLNAVIHQLGGSDAVMIQGKERNTYRVVAELNNVAIRGTLAHVIQTLEDVRQTRAAYSDEELQRMTELELREARMLREIQPQGHLDIIRVVSQVIEGCPDLALH